MRNSKLGSIRCVAIVLVVVGLASYSPMTQQFYHPYLRETSMTVDQRTVNIENADTAACQRCNPLSNFLSKDQILSFTHIAKCGGVSWFEELRQVIFNDRLFPKVSAGEEYSLAFQNELVTQQTNSSTTSFTKLVSFRNPRRHLYSQFRHCAYSAWGKDQAPHFPRHDNFSVNDFEVWLDSFWNPATNTPITTKEVPYPCYHPANLQTRSLTTYKKAPAFSWNGPFQIEPDYNSALQSYRDYDWVGILEFFHESKCLLYYRILLSGDDDNYNNNDLKQSKQQISIMAEYLQETCTCTPKPESVLKKEVQYGSQTNYTSNPVVIDARIPGFQDVHYAHDNRGVLLLEDVDDGFFKELHHKMDRLTRIDQSFYRMALVEFLKEMVWLESQLFGGSRQVLCDHVLQTNEKALSYLNISILETYQALKAEANEEYVRIS